MTVVKPTGAEFALQTGHALWSGLLAYIPCHEASGQPVDYVRNVTGYTYKRVSGTGTSFTWYPTGTFGPGVRVEYNVGNDYQGVAWNAASCTGITDQWSLLYVGDVVGARWSAMFARANDDTGWFGAVAGFGPTVRSTNPNDTRVYAARSTYDDFGPPPAHNTGFVTSVTIRSGTSIKYYVNGVEYLNTTCAATAEIDGTGMFLFGKFPNNVDTIASAPTNGRIDAGALWNRALTPAEVSTVTTDPWVLSRVSSQPIQVDIGVDVDVSNGGIVTLALNQLADGDLAVVVSHPGDYTGDLTVNSIAVSGDYTLTSDISATLSVGQSATGGITVDTTQVAGSYSGLLTVSYTGGSEYSTFSHLSTINLTLSDPGTGIYYIDYDNGDDNNSARTTGQAWKHDPEDPNASGVAGALSLLPGTTLQYKPGVTYYGNAHSSDRTGSSGLPILRVGTGSWAAGTGIIDGSTPVTGWTQCATQDEAVGSPDYLNCWYASIPSTVEAMSAHAYSGSAGILLQAKSNNPTLSDPYEVDATSNMFTITTGQITSGSIQDATNLSLIYTGWANVGSPHIMTWQVPNIVYRYPVTGFDPSTNTLYYWNQSSSAPYTDRDSYYCLYNVGAILTGENEYVIDTGTNRIIMKSSAGAPTDITVSSPGHGFYYSKGSYNEVRGFEMRKFSADSVNDGAGIVIPAGSPATGFVLKDIYVHDVRNASRNASVFLSALVNSTVDNVVVKDTVFSRGVTIGATGSTITNVVVEHAGGTSLYFPGSIYTVVSGCIAKDFAGVHANGITAYQGCKELWFYDCQAYGGNIALTTQHATGVYFVGCYFQTDLSAYAWADWGSAGGSLSQNLKAWNCVFKGPTGGAAISIYTGSYSGFSLVNSILIGTNNVWDAGGEFRDCISIHDDLGAGWDAYATGNNIITGYTQDQIFTSIDTHDFSLLATSPAIDSGDTGIIANYDGLSYGYTWNTMGAGPDIGALEYNTGAVVVISSPPYRVMMPGYTKKLRQLGLIN